jgi:hypothetical protein
MKWKDINKYVYSALGLGGIGVIVMITLLGDVNVNYTNFPDCVNGTNCYAGFDMSLNKTSYWTQICLNIDEKVTIPQIYKKSTYGRTLWINTSINGFIRTQPEIPNQLMITTTKANAVDISPDGKYLRFVQTGDCITKTKNTSFYVKAIKNKFEEITWKMDLFKIDPVWKGINITLQYPCQRNDTYKENKPVCVNSTYPNGTIYKICTANYTTVKYCADNSVQYLKVGNIANCKTKEELGIYCSYYNDNPKIIVCDDAHRDGNGDGIIQPGESYIIIRNSGIDFEGFDKHDLKKRIKNCGDLDE